MNRRMESKRPAPRLDGLAGGRQGFGYPWGPGHAPPGYIGQYAQPPERRENVPQQAKRAVPDELQLTPIPPVKPFPPDPYINQFPLNEVLKTGTLFQWLHDPYEPLIEAGDPEIRDEENDEKNNEKNKAPKNEEA